MSNLRLPYGQQVRVVALSSLLLLAACGEKPQQAAQGDMKVPVSVVTVQPTPTEVLVELPGRVEAIKDAQIRARVNGIVTEINFVQGGDVKAGQLLFTIDPAPYRAARAQAAAQLQRAQADAKSARLLAQRYSTLIKANAVSRQEYDNATAAAGQADAAIAAAKAALDTADIDLGYTKVVSPIDGRIGKSLVTEGALVSATAATQMATVQQLDRVYVDLTRSTTELAQLRRALANGELERLGDGDAKAQAVLEDGSNYDLPGKLLFSGVTVDPTTGQVNLRAEFPNPDNILLPGMYVRVRLQQGVDEKALLVPQQALQRTADGLSSLMLVKDGKVEVKAVTVGPGIGGKWIISKGLAAGDVVIVEGFQKIRPGAAVQGIPWDPQAKAGDAKAPPAAKADAGAPGPGAEKPESQPADETPSSKPAPKG
ncbi:efflux RND transporter periplasmic adaptor subunit [Pollutimonas bauzanensis]|uniref:Membrane fusion protein, multidrug efflux system n=1 Tax=Pollutimonas bauzanensis TaxID=658167 RepID=A0A1M5ZCH4_9BURK|nr:efflux RND transporter periplasmic adaptor subunit [Pollutimonas bauzanensis]SHI21643.1 membrane fusion protein, multidrug efflux system [Pollutimonas bauzanensis]